MAENFWTSGLKPGELAGKEKGVIIEGVFHWDASLENL